MEKAPVLGTPTEKTDAQAAATIGGPAAKQEAKAAEKPAAPLTPMDQLRKTIEDEKKRRMGFIYDVKSARNRLAYKLADKQAISQLSDISKSNTKNIGFLRKKKEQIEFRIATEAFTLEAERDLIRKKNEIEKEFESALKSYRLRKKLEFIDKDIEELGKRITESEAKIKESDKKLDDLYNSLRSMTGEAKRRPRTEKKQHNREEHKPVEISFADIAIMKDKKEKEEKKEETDLDESMMN